MTGGIKLWVSGFRQAGSSSRKSLNWASIEKRAGSGGSPESKSRPKSKGMFSRRGNRMIWLPKAKNKEIYQVWKGRDSIKGWQ